MQSIRRDLSTPPTADGCCCAEGGLEGDLPKYDKFESSQVKCVKKSYFCFWFAIYAFELTPGDPRSRLKMEVRFACAAHRLSTAARCPVTHHSFISLIRAAPMAAGETALRGGQPLSPGS